MTSEIHYGGSVTDAMDQRLLTSLLKRCFAASEADPEAEDNALKHYVLPPDYHYKDIKEFVMSLPVDPAPGVLGFDAGAAIV